MEDKFRLLLYSINYSPELTGIGKYNGEMAYWLADSGHEVDVICAPPYYPEWRVHDGYSPYFYKRRKKSGITVTRCPVYVPKQPNTLKRLFHLASFAFSSSLSLLGKLVRKPRVLFVVEPTLLCLPFALLFCKLTRTKAILHIQDYEVDAMVGLDMASSPVTNYFLRWAYRLESRLIRSFDAVSTISYSMIDRAIDKGVAPEKVLYFPNWSDTEFVKPGVDGTHIRQQWGISDSQKILLYAGNIGAKQGLELVIEAADQLSHLDDLIFVIVGNGANISTLKAMVESKSLNNVHFFDLLEWKDVPAMLAAADLHLVVQRKGAADAVLPSKLSNILSAGGYAVVTAEQETELGRLAQKHEGIYSCVQPEDVDDFVTGIHVELERSAVAPVNRIAREYAEQNLDKDAILERFKSDVEQILFADDAREIVKQAMNASKSNGLIAEGEVEAELTTSVGDAHPQNLDYSNFAVKQKVETV